MKSLIIAWLGIIRALPSTVVIALIRAYQLVLSPLLGPRCKFAPTCSHYGLDAVRIHGAFVGSAMALWRVLRCNPWSVGGVDDVPARGQSRFRLHRNNGAMAPASAVRTTGERTLVR